MKPARCQAVCLLCGLLAFARVGSSAAVVNPPAAPPATQPVDAGLTFDEPVGLSKDDVVKTRFEAEEGRGSSDSTLATVAWATPGVGLTAKPRPSLAWYLNKPTGLKIALVLKDEKHHKTVRLWESSGTVPAGVHVLDTSASNFSLEPGVDWKWTVRVINDETDPSKDTDSGGVIRRVEASDANAAGHAFYDAIGAAATELDNSARSNDPARVAAAKAAVSRLLGKVDLPAPANLTVTRDTAGRWHGA